MSKDKPEVGDVWEYKYKEFETKFYVSAIAHNPCPEYYCFVLYKNGNNEFVGCWWDKERWDKAMMTYLGKSKAKIEDLFEIKENQNDKIL